MKRKITKLKIGELSVTGKPAQKEAMAVIMKSMVEDEPEPVTAIKAETARKAFDHIVKAHVESGQSNVEALRKSRQLYPDLHREAFGLVAVQQKIAKTKPKPDDNPMMAEAIRIRKADGCSNVESLRRARQTMEMAD